MERMSGTDAFLWHMERPGTPMHTLKTVILDPSQLGRQITLADLEAALEPRLGLLPRLTQRVQAAPYFPGRPFWVADPDFKLDQHFDEVWLPEPGGRAELDELHSSLQETPLDRRRPPWSATLVHGLASGRQAVVVRIHHAITDGMGALNMLLLLTTASPDEKVPSAPLDTSLQVSVRELARSAVRQVPGHIGQFGRLIVHAVGSRGEVREFRKKYVDLPSGLRAPRLFINKRSKGHRLCASTDLDFSDIRAVSKAAGVTINGVYHALIAAALRDELRRLGEDSSRPVVAAFGIATDPANRHRVAGNHVTPTYVNLFCNVEDPVERLMLTGSSCRQGVELRKLTGLKMAGVWADYTCRLAPMMVHSSGHRMPKLITNLATANVAGPPERRFVGPVEVVDWISFALVHLPVYLNITAYSYAGRMSIGLVTTPEVLPEPRRMLDRMDEELRVLKRALLSTEIREVADSEETSIGS
jgi:diacylglycerol O-acyltransferase